MISIAEYGAGGQSGLSRYLHSQFIDWAQVRKPQEDQMLECYEHKMRIQRAAIDRSGTGLPPTQKSRVFSGLTRGKIRSARAKIIDVLFGSGKMPFDSVPTQEDLAPFSDAIEKILTYQLDCSDWREVMADAIDDIATYGTGFILGPWTRKEQYESMSSEGGLQSDSMTYTMPYFERASPMDIYPDPDGNSIAEGAGVYWATLKPKHFIRALQGKKGYRDEALKYALTQQVTSQTNEGSDRLRDARLNSYRYSKDGRIWYARYFGLVKERDLEEQSAHTDDEMVEVIVQMAGGEVIKVDRNPYHNERRPIYRSTYESEPGEIWGTGIARNNRDNLKVINASFQLYLEGKAFSLLKMCSIDRSKFTDREDFQLFPGKRFDMKMNLSPAERESAIIWHDVVDVSGGWERAIEIAERFSDDDTGITKYSQGSDSRSLNDTATGISMIMSASSLPLKEVITHIDNDWIEPMVNDLLQWDLEFLDPDVVHAQLGAEAAQIWAQVKEYGKASFVKLQPSGSGTMMMREVLMQKLTGFMTLALGNPATAQYIDVPEILKQVWESGEVGRESPVLTEADLQAKAQMGGMPPGPPGMMPPGAPGVGVGGGMDPNQMMMPPPDMDVPPPDMEGMGMVDPGMDPGIPPGSMPPPEMGDPRGPNARMEDLLANQIMVMLDTRRAEEDARAVSLAAEQEAAAQAVAATDRRITALLDELADLRKEQSGLQQSANADRDRLTELMAHFVASQHEGNRLAAATKVAVRDLATGLIERVEVMP